MLWADTIPESASRRFRAMYKPRRFRELTCIELLVDGVSTEVQLTTAMGDGCARGQKMAPLPPLRRQGKRSRVRTWLRVGVLPLSWLARSSPTQFLNLSPTGMTP